jgi:predicted RNA binding protein YcfA (HicA-like mRNA interferase family)
LHVVLRKFKNSEKIVIIVPMHEEVKTGTLLEILKFTRITKEEFMENLN